MLKKLVLSGVDKKDAVLKFTKGLNVISGDSDTGKTYAFQCINYMLGAETPPKLIKEADGYTTLSLEFQVNDDKYQLERNLGSNSVNVYHNADSFTLSYKHDATNTNNLSRFLLGLLLEDNTTVFLKKSQVKHRTLSFRDIVHLCIAEETEIIQESSTFQSIQYTDKTVRKSVLKYIITGIDDKDSISNENVEMENIRRAGVVEFLNKKKKSISDRIEEIESSNSYKIYSADPRLPSMLQEINNHRQLLSEYSSEFTENEDVISTLKRNGYDDELQISELHQLRHHYLDLLSKNGIVTTHTDFLSQLPQLECPVCNQSLKHGLLDPSIEEQLFNYFSETNLVLKNKIDELDILLADIATRVEDRTEKIKNLEKRNNELSDLISHERDILKTMSKNIAIIRNLDAMKKTIEIYRQDLISVESDIIAYSEKITKAPTPVTIQDLTPFEDYCHVIEAVLKSWGLGDHIEVYFDVNTLDLTINGKPRSSWGKGYRALIMSAMLISLSRYCCQHDRLHPGFVIIDSPLVSLKERKKADDKWVEDYIEKRMIDDILKEDTSRQVIIFENKNLKYDYDYNYCEFVHDGDGRKGFIPT